MNGSLTSLGGTTQEITVQAQQSSSVSLNIPIAVTPSSAGSVGSLLPTNSNASASWQMAGMLSVGRIPNRITVCATVSPIGGGADDSTHINNAITACPSGQVVLLAPGTFTIAEDKPGTFTIAEDNLS